MTMSSTRKKISPPLSSPVTTGPKRGAMSKKFLLRMNPEQYSVLLSESQRINVSVTALVNFIINSFIEKQKIQSDESRQQGVE